MDPLRQRLQVGKPDELDPIYPKTQCSSFASATIFTRMPGHRVIANQPNGSLFDLDMEIVRRERRVSVGGERLVELVLKPRDHTISLLLIVRAPDTVDFRKRAGHWSFRITATGLQLAHEHEGCSVKELETGRLKP